MILVNLPAGVPVVIVAKADSSIPQRVTLYRSDGVTQFAQWEGIHEERFGGTTVTAGSGSYPDYALYLRIDSRWDPPHDTTWSEAAYHVRPPQVGGGYSHTYIGGDDRGAYPGAGSDHDYDDTIVSFSVFTGLRESLPGDLDIDWKRVQAELSKDANTRGKDGEVSITIEGGANAAENKRLDP